MELMAELWEVVTVYGKYPLLWIFGVMMVTYANPKSVLEIELITICDSVKNRRRL